MKDCGVNILQNTNVKEVKANGLTLIDETGTDYEFPADLVIVTAGTSQSQFVKDLPLTKDANGRILTSDTLQSMDYPFVFAMGDCASIDGYRLPSTAQVAMQQADIVGKNVVDYLKMPTIESSGNNTQATTNDLKKFRFLNLGEMLTLGDTNAAITSLGGLVELSGPLAAIGRRAIYAYRMPTSRQMVKALVTASATTTGKILGSIFNKNK